MRCSHMDKMSALQSAIDLEPETGLMATKKAHEKGTESALMATDWEKQ